MAAIVKVSLPQQDPRGNWSITVSKDWNWADNERAWFSLAKALKKSGDKDPREWDRQSPGSDTLSRRIHAGKEKEEAQLVRAALIGNLEAGGLVVKAEEEQRPRHPYRESVLRAFIKEAVVLEAMKQVQWTRPSLDEEYDEIERTGGELDIDPEEIFSRARVAELTPLSDKMWRDLENTDSWDTQDEDKVRTLASRYGKDIDSVYKGFDDGATMPAPIVLMVAGAPPYLIAGNTRLMVARSRGVRPMVLLVVM